MRCVLGLLINVLCLVIAFQSARACETRSLTVLGNLNSETAPIDAPPDFTEDPGAQIAAAQVVMDLPIVDSRGVSHTAKLLFFRNDNTEVPWFLRIIVTDEEFVLFPNGGRVWGEHGLNYLENGHRFTVRPDIGGLFAWLSGATNDIVEMTFLPTNLPQDTLLHIEQDGREGGCVQRGNLDYDGDGKDDLAIFRPQLGIWAILKSSTKQVEFIFKQWGLPGDHAMPGDYTGDGIADLVVWRPSEGNWYICKSEGQFSCTDAVIVQFGLPEDVPLEGDFDGDRILDQAVWRPSNGNFYYRSSFTGETIQRQWGLPGDVPLQGGRAE
jgi:hypothetical protein